MHLLDGEFVKVCSRCKEPKLASLDRSRSDFSPGDSKGDGFYYYCKGCNGARAASRHPTKDPFGISANSIERTVKVTPEMRKRRLIFEEESRLMENWAANDFEPVCVLKPGGGWI